MKKLNVPMSQPDLTDAEREAVASVLNSNALSMGPWLRQFEESIQNFCGVNHAIAVNSGTSGLHLCVRASGWQAGDMVITTPFSFVASTNALLYENITPIFVDVNPQTGNMDPNQAVQAAYDLHGASSARKRWLPPQGFSDQGKLKGMLPIDVFGQPADYDTLQPVCQEFSLTVIEDSCEALGAEYKGRKAGSLADFGVFAFYPNKQITTGEGGMVVTQSDQAADLIRAMRNQGRAPGDTWLDHTYLGYNYRLDEMSAALGAVQMRRIETLLKNRQQVADWYQQELQGISGITIPFTAATTTRNSWFVYVVQLAPELDRNRVMQQLEGLGIPVRPYFSPIHHQKYIRDRFGYENGRFPVTEQLGRQGMAIPFSGKMTFEQVQEVVFALRQVL